MSKLHSWLTNQNDLIPLGVMLHNEVAKDRGFEDNIEALKAGWIRFGLEFNDRLYVELWDAGDLSSIERLEEFLYRYWMPRRRKDSMVALEIHRPIGSYIYFLKEQVENEGFKDLLASLIRRAVLNKKR